MGGHRPLTHKKGDIMKPYFDIIDNVSFSDQAVDALFTLALLLGLFTFIGGVSWAFVKIWEWRESRREKTIVRRVL